MSTRRRKPPSRQTNIWVARAVPVLLLAIIGYASWVLTKLVCVDYLINPPPSLLLRPQRGAAIAILVTFYVILIITIVVYGRLLDTIARHPGLIPRGRQWYVEKERRSAKDGKRRRRTSSRSSNGNPSSAAAAVVAEEKSTKSASTQYTEPREITYLANETLPFKVDEFWHRDVFACNADGRPPFCSSCYNYKPDRAHHCSELNRCVLKMDHFCPWVGGIVSETSFKYFIQFTFYAALLCTHILITVAYFFAQRKNLTGGMNANWIVVIAIAGLFWLFSAGMWSSTCQFAVTNSTTIENLGRKTKVWFLAVYISPEALDQAQRKGIELRLISYPRPAEEQAQLLNQNGAQTTSETAAESPTVASAAASKSMAGMHRVFAILETEPGQNPWNLGYLRNFQETMGYTIGEWLLPIKPSPCFKHDDPTSLYKLGPVVEEMKAKFGIDSWMTTDQRRRRHRRIRSGSSNRSRRSRVQANSAE